MYTLGMPIRYVKKTLDLLMG
ncbi:protein of unknown function [Cardinium endosymbiont cEper1 of Encarsia pergandiella]|nr:protein of unknown function [Cardinium endosymbiont cEper1 of Encarsia pergandiella]